MNIPPAQRTGLLRPLLALALPVVVINYLHVAVEYVDTWLAGNFLAGAAPLAAINQIRYLMWFVFMLFAVVSIGATALVARSVGAGDRRSAVAATNQAFVLGLGASLVLTAAGWAWLEPLVSLLQLSTGAQRLAITYLRIILPLLPAIMIEEVGIACLRGAGDTVSGLVIVAVVNVVNVVVSVGFLLGLGPLPELGWLGLAIGTATARLVGGLIIFLLLLRGRAGLRLRLGSMRPDRQMQRRLLRIGVPGGIDSIVVVICHMGFVALINRLGNLAAAAHGVGVSIEALAYMPGAAFQAAAATLAGQFLGAGQPRRASHSVWLACLVSCGLMSLAGLLFFFGSAQLAGFFLGPSNAEVAPVAAHLLRITAVSMPALALSMVLTGGLRGAGDTRWPLFISIVGLVGVRIPLAVWLAYDVVHVPLVGVEFAGWNLGVVGAWYAMVVDVYLRCLLTSLRWWHGGWQRVEV